MYPIEIYLQTLKKYVRNLAHPKSSIVEGYLADECLTFCSRYFHGIETRFNRVERNWDGDHLQPYEGLPIFSPIGRALGRGYDERKVSKQLLDLAHGPLEEAVCYNGYIVNGFRFRKNEVDCNRRTQSCRVLVKGDASTNNCDYYGVLIDIIELHYMVGNKIAMFKCE